MSIHAHALHLNFQTTIRIQATSPSPQQEATLQLANRVAMTTIITLNKVVLHFHANPCLDTKIQWKISSEIPYSQAFKLLVYSNRTTSIFQLTKCKNTASTNAKYLALKAKKKTHA
jgi:hypothetical protein